MIVLSLFLSAEALADIPQISKWLDGSREPVNIVIFDLVSGTAKEANLKISKACGQAGYKNQLERLEAGDNQGRVLGPYYFQGYYYFIGSFRGTRARDDFARKLEKKTDYKVIGFLPLDNVAVNDSFSPAGDHDGIAVLLALR